MINNTEKANRLTQKQKLFCKYYATVGDTFQNATQSYIKAGYSKNGARENASTLLHNPAIESELDRIAIESASTLTNLYKPRPNSGCRRIDGDGASRLQRVAMYATYLPTRDGPPGLWLDIVSSQRHGNFGVGCSPSQEPWPDKPDVTCNCSGSQQ